ncbi:MAG: hypothetical protein M9916_10415 [Crocinitomicaceae bacterium]|nr:hypothetical protein [Crocinitomicaceae bacterium]
MKTAICTISTKSHLFKSHALFESIKKYSSTSLYCLVTDSNNFETVEGVNYHEINDLKNNNIQQLTNKYTGDKLRWSLKSVYVKFLLESGYERVIYVDNDIFFYSSPDALFEKLENSDFLLTPHFYKADPTKEQNWLEANFRVGLYNAGFFGANRNAITILDWWTDCCLYEVKKAYWRGLFDDQKYLDLIPIQFNNVEVIKNRGCNFAGWNSDNAKIEKIDNQLFINGDKLVFIHFAALSMERFSTNQSIVYSSYMQYLESLRKYNSSFNYQKKILNFTSFSNYCYFLKWKFARLFCKK